jgi:hypothetical protein
MEGMLFVTFYVFELYVKSEPCRRTLVNLPAGVYTAARQMEPRNI